MLHYICILFENAEFGKVRTMVMPDGQVGFLGKDVAEALGYKNTRDALLKHVEEDDKTTVAICDAGSNYKSQAILISESEEAFIANAKKTIKIVNVTCNCYK